MSHPFFHSGPRLAVAALMLISSLGLVGCSRPQPNEEPVRAVKVMTMAYGELQTTQEYAGDIRPRIESRLGFRVAGKLVSREVELGQTVKAGQVLARLDAQDYRLASEAAQAQLVAATTNRDLAAADLKRFRELREQNFISDAELQRRQAAWQAAQAQLDQAQAQLSTQRNQGSYTTLLADVAGVVTAIEAEPGQVTSAGQVVVRVAQTGARDAVFAVPEDQLGRVRLGKPVTAAVWPGAVQLKGQVREISASADPVTRTYQVKATLDGAPPLGATVTVKLEDLRDKRSGVLKLPTSALRQDKQATAVWVLDPKTMTLHSQSVQIASADGNEAVISAGLQEGQQVVVAGVHVLSEGQKVTVYRERPLGKQSDITQSAVGATPETGAAFPAKPK